MNATLVRRLLFPAYEWALGRSTLALLEQLESSQHLATPAIRSLQRDGLHQLVGHARRAIPYWRERLSRLPEKWPDDPATALAAVPVLTRAEIVRDRERMRWPDAPGKVLVHRSGGTTDDNLTFYWSRTRQSWDRAMRYRGLARQGIRPGDRVLHLWPRYPRRTWAGRVKEWLRDLRDRLINDEVFDLRPLDPAQLQAGLATIRRYRPAALIGYPSWLTALAEHIRNHEPHFRLAGLRRILSTGEVLFGFQRRTIEETFQAPVFVEYGSQDSGLIAHEDENGRFRLNAEQMIVEVLRNGAPATPGQLGEVVVTHFYTEVMPFIRYATGDVVRQPAPDEEDRPTQGLPTFPTPEGRTSDLLVDVAGELHPPRPVIDALVEQVGYREFSLFQPLPEEVTVLEVAGRNPAGRRSEIEAVLRSFLGRSLRVGWESGAGFRPLTSGKRRFTCSPVALERIAHDQESGLRHSRAWRQRLLP